MRRQDSTLGAGWGAHSIPRTKQGKDFPSSQRPGRTAPFLKVTRSCFCFLGPGKWETLSFRSRSPRPGWMEGPDSRGRCPTLVSWVQGFLQKGRPSASRRVALTSRPGPRSTGCDPRVRLARSPSDAPGCAWRLLSFPQRLARLPSFAETPWPISTTASGPCLRLSQ